MSKKTKYKVWSETLCAYVYRYAYSKEQALPLLRDAVTSKCGSYGKEVNIGKVKEA